MQEQWCGFFQVNIYKNRQLVGNGLLTDIDENKRFLGLLLRKLLSKAYSLIPSSDKAEISNGRETLPKGRVVFPLPKEGHLLSHLSSMISEL